jgi:hypothetical protein
VSGLDKVQSADKKGIGKQGGDQQTRRGMMQSANEEGYETIRDKEGYEAISR